MNAAKKKLRDEGVKVERVNMAPGCYETVYVLTRGAYGETARIGEGETLRIPLQVLNAMRTKPPLVRQPAWEAIIEHAKGLNE